MGRTSLLFALIAVAAGGVIGYVLGSQSVVESAGDAGGTAVTVERPDSPDALQPPAAGEIAHSLEDFLNAIPAPEPETGIGVITGKVTNSGGQPVAGVLVRARPKRPYVSSSSRSGGPPKDKELVEAVLGVVNRHHAKLADRREAISDADGSFRLRGLLELPYSFRAYREGYRINRTREEPQYASPGAKITFVADPVVHLEVLVLLPGGDAPEAASLSVEATDGSNRYGRSWSPEDNRLRLAPGTYRIRAESGEPMRFESDTEEIEVREGENPAPLVLRLSEQRVVFGKVVFSEGETVSFCEVAILKVASGTAPNPALLVKAPHRTHVRAGHPVFSFRDLTPGTYLIGVLLGYQQVPVHETIEVEDGAVERDLRMPAPDPSEFVVVRVVDPDGRPIEKVDFETEYLTETSQSRGGSRVQKLPDGNWRVYHHVGPHGSPEGGRYGITARAKGFGSKRVLYRKEETSQLTIRLLAPAELVLTVADYLGSGREGLLTASLWIAEGQGMRGVGGTGDLSHDGAYRFTGLAPGTYELRLDLRSGRGTKIPIAWTPVTLKSGPNVESLTIPSLYSLTVLVEESDGDSRFRVRPAERDYWAYDALSPAEGRIVFENLPAGRYAIERWGRAFATMYVTVPGKSLVRFTPAKFDAYRVNVTDQSGRLARAGFQDGDLIVGIDGEPFKSEAHMSALMTLAQEPKAVAFDVLRGGRTLKIRVASGESLVPDSTRGGTWQMATR